LGRLALIDGRPEEARSYQEQALRIAQELDARTDMCWILTDLGDLDGADGDRALAAERYARVVELSHSVQDAGLGIHALLGMARLAEQEGDPDRATAWFAELATLGRDRNDLFLTAISLEGLARNSGSSCGLERAALLLGALAAHRTAAGTFHPPHEQSEHERRIAMVRSILGEERFGAAWREGQALTLEQAVAKALKN